MLETRIFPLNYLVSYKLDMRLNGSGKLNDKDDIEINDVLVTDRATYSAIAEKPPNPLTSLRTRVGWTLTDSLKGSLCKPLNSSRAQQFQTNFEKIQS